MAEAYFIISETTRLARHDAGHSCKDPWEWRSICDNLWKRVSEKICSYQHSMRLFVQSFAIWITTNDCITRNSIQDAPDMIREGSREVLLLHPRSVTDNKPLSQILHPMRSLPVWCNSRMAICVDYLWQLIYDVLYKSTKEIVTADYYSRIERASASNEVNKLSCREERDMVKTRANALNQIAQLSTSLVKRVKIQSLVKLFRL